MARPSPHTEHAGKPGDGGMGESWPAAMAANETRESTRSILVEVAIVFVPVVVLIVGLVVSDVAVCESQSSRSCRSFLVCMVCG